MKKVLFTALAVLGMVAVNAQEESTDSNFDFSGGDIIVEGNLMFSSSTDKTTADVEEVTNRFNVNPKAGFFVTDNIVAGIEVSFGSSKQETTTTSGTNVTVSTTSADVNTPSSSFNGGVFARYYFLEAGKRFKAHTEFGFGFGSSKMESSSVNAAGVVTTNTAPSAKTIAAGVDLGLNYFVKENIAITFVLADLLSYSSNEVDEAPGGTSTFNANLNNLNNFFNGAQFGLLFKL